MKGGDLRSGGLGASGKPWIALAHTTDTDSQALSAGVPAAVIWNVEEAGLLKAGITHSTTVSPANITMTATGLYLISAVVGIAAGVGMSDGRVSIAVNGTAVCYAQAAVGAFDLSIAVSTPLILVPNDVVTILVMAMGGDGTVAQGETGSAGPTWTRIVRLANGQ